MKSGQLTLHELNAFDMFIEVQLLWFSEISKHTSVS